MIGPECAAADPLTAADVVCRDGDLDLLLDDRALWATLRT